jgi:taurine dioxygenase
MTLATTTQDVRRIGGRIGAEIVGVDLAQPIDTDLAARLNSALVEH